MPRRIASIDLRAEHVPGDVVVSPEGPGAGPGEGADEGAGRVAGVQPIVDFAHTFNGYAYGGAPHQLAPVVDDVEQRWRDGEGLPRDLDRLRACLFYWARVRRHGAGQPVTAREAAWLNALLGAIRDVLADRSTRAT